MNIKQTDRTTLISSLGTDNEEYNKIAKTINSDLPAVYAPPFECCKNCSNNPANNKFSSGVCSCTLPFLEKPWTC